MISNNVFFQDYEKSEIIIEAQSETQNEDQIKIVDATLLVAL